MPAVSRSFAKVCSGGPKGAWNKVTRSMGTSLIVLDGFVQCGLSHICHGGQWGTEVTEGNRAGKGVSWRPLNRGETWHSKTLAYRVVISWDLLWRRRLLRPPAERCSP